MPAAELVHARAHRLERRFHCKRRTDEGADACPANHVDPYAVIGQRAADAEMRQTARAAAGEDEAQSAPSYEPRGAAEIGARAHMKMSIRIESLEPGRRLAGHDATRPQEDDFDRDMRTSAIRERFHAAGHIRSASANEDRVGLT